MISQPPPLLLRKIHPCHLPKVVGMQMFHLILTLPPVLPVTTDIPTDHGYRYVPSFLFVILLFCLLDTALILKNMCVCVRLFLQQDTMTVAETMADTAMETLLFLPNVLLGIVGIGNNTESINDTSNAPFFASSNQPPPSLHGKSVENHWWIQNIRRYYIHWIASHTTGYLGFIYLPVW